MPDPKDISQRKADHIALCVSGDVGFDAKSTLFEDVELVHDALPELDIDAIELGVDILGKKLRAPLIIAAMTGGTPAAAAINRDLAAAAEAFGIGFAFGSQRPLLTRGIEDGYRIRDVAPTTLIIGNIGIVQARETPTARLREMAVSSGCDALAVHLNPAMEVVQPEGDGDFRGGMDTLRRLVGELGLPLMVKETGCGLSRRVGARLRTVGVEWADVSGAGGTSWVAVEMHRAEASGKVLGARFRDWGIPTAASVAQLRGIGLGFVATGGVSDGLTVAKALALGANAAGIARPFLKAQARGKDALHTAIAEVLAELRVACLLTGSADVAQLRSAPYVFGARLQRWIDAAKPD